MKVELTRRKWLKACGGTIGAGMLPASALGLQSDSAAPPEAKKADLDSFPQQSPDLVRETVGASHGKIDRVRELVTAYPELAKSSWDWGFGDWESPLEAAAHTGQREIALFLMQQGARPSLLTFAMLGELNIVKAVLAADPQQLHTAGAHGLTLLHHAQAGGDQANGVVDHLLSLGAVESDSTVPAKEITDALVGEYKSAADNATLMVEVKRFGLSVRGNRGSDRRLIRLDDGAWSPAGAPSVRLRFEPAEGKATFLTLTMGGKTIRAERSS